MQTKWIGELGSNHNGNLERARRLIIEASQAGFWGVKVQDFKVELLFSDEALTQRPELMERRKSELPQSWHSELSALSRTLCMPYGVTPFDTYAVKEAAPYVNFWKISSYQMLDHAIMADVARTRKPVVLSTGMATMEEIMEARRVILEAGCPHLTLLHCVSCYPSPPVASNLGAIDQMQKFCGVPIGWSDHSGDMEVVCRAVWRWRAAMVELHVDLNDKQGVEYGGGHCWSIEGAERVIRVTSELPQELKREHLFDGSGRKHPALCEHTERDWRSDPSDGLRPMKKTRARLGLKQEA